MDLSRPPQVGAIISFCYLWQREFQAGLVEGGKIRPCLVVAVEVERGQGPSRPWVTVLPITRTPPRGSRAVAMPLETNRRLGLDEDASWIVLGEANAFLWPGYDIRTVPGADTWLYGHVGQGTFRTVRREIADVLRGGPHAAAVDRGG